ncbi:hypothetical protein GGR42_002105 [Saonia flava]|uniref:Lipocalin-like domain-containing protein n=1 Tax=Saonia flava TaxID=523696 RepID=A0A846QZM4_9FLAO|nr:lipocalin-like domain-containing protein [Saonia flava]NJB71643.1 hypothetical protein [Saonia flava]
MKGLTKRSILFISLLALVFSCKEAVVGSKDTTPTDPLMGSWEMSSIHWISKDTTYTIESAQPGIFMIDENRYSIMWTPIEGPRTPFKVLSNPTDDEIKAGFRSVVFNAGSYIMTDSTLTTTAKIAKVPGFEEGLQFYTYKIQKNALELTMIDETYPDGTKPEWSGTWKTKFEFEKVN